MLQQLYIIMHEVSNHDCSSFFWFCGKSIFN